MSVETATKGWKSLRGLAVSETGFIFDPGTGMTFQVNPTGRFVLQKLREGLPTRRIEEALQGAFEVDGEDLKRDIAEFVLMLKESELLRDGEETGW